MLVECGYLVSDGCNYHEHCSCSLNMVIWSRMSAIYPNDYLNFWNVVIWSLTSQTLFLLVEYGYLVPIRCTSKTLFVLLEYGYLVPNECLFKSSLCLWNVVIWSQMGAIISNIVPVCGVWLFGPNLVHIKNIVCAP